MFLNNINFNPQLIRFMEVYKPKLHTLMTNQLLDDTEFNISNQYKTIMYINNCFDYIDSIFKKEAPYKAWGIINTDANFTSIRRKLAYLGYDLDTMIAMYINPTIDDSLQLGISENPIVESIPVPFDRYIYKPIAQHLLFKEFRFGLSTQTNDITYAEFNDATVITLNDIYNDINIMLNNINNMCPFVAIEAPDVIRSIMDDTDETINDYVNITFVHINGKTYNCRRLDGITSIATFNRIIKIGL